MKQIFILVFITSLLLNACGPARGIEVREPWIRPVTQGENGAVYLIIHNHSSTADELIRVSTDVAAAIEIHESKMNGDVMEMRQLESLPLAGDTEIQFEPGGLHIMLVDLRRDLRVGDEIQITLHFQSFEDLEVLVPVRDTPAPEEHH